MEIIKLDDVANKITEVRGQQVILDSDVANLYGVHTRDVNKAVKNNPAKFPDGYIFELNESEMSDLRWKFSTAKFSKTRFMPKCFTEKGLYMLATILKSPTATGTTIAIIEAFTELRELARTIKTLSSAQDKNTQKSLMRKSGELMTEILGDGFETSGSETSIELNFAVLKFKHTIKKDKKQNHGRLK